MRLSSGESVKQKPVTKIQLEDLFNQPVQIKICQPTSILQLLSHQFNNAQPFNNVNQAKDVFNRVVVLKCGSIKQALILLTIALNKQNLKQRMQGIKDYFNRDQTTRSLHFLQNYVNYITYNPDGNTLRAVEEIIHTKISNQGKLDYVNKIISGMSLNQVKSFFYKTISEQTTLNCLKRATVHYIDDQGDHLAKLYTLKKYELPENTSDYQYIYICYGVSDSCYLIVVNAKNAERVWNEETNRLKLSIQDVNEQVLNNEGFLYRQSKIIVEQEVEKMDFSKFKETQDPIPQLIFKSKIQSETDRKQQEQQKEKRERKERKERKNSNLLQNVIAVCIIVLVFSLFLYGLITFAPGRE